MNKSLVIESTTASLRRVEEFLEEISQEAGFSGESYGKVLVSVMEAVNNAIIHGNHGDVSKRVTILLGYESSTLSITVTDEGNGFSPEMIPDPTSPENIENIRGRGVFLMRRLADTIEYNHTGNSVTMSFNRPQG